LGAQASSIDSFEQVGHDDAIDHVGHNCNPWAITQPDGEHNPGAQSPDGSVESNCAGRTAEAGHDQSLAARHLTKRAGSGGEPQGGCFHGNEYGDPL
jgi:hypothetical protein